MDHHELSSLQSNREWREDIFLQEKLVEDHAALKSRLFPVYVPASQRLSSVGSPQKKTSLAEKMNRRKTQSLAEAIQATQENSFEQTVHRLYRELDGYYDMYAYNEVAMSNNDYHIGLDEISITLLLRDIFQIEDFNEIQLLRNALLQRSRKIAKLNGMAPNLVGKIDVFRAFQPLVSHTALCHQTVNGKVRPVGELELFLTAHAVVKKMEVKTGDPNLIDIPLLERQLSKPDHDTLRAALVAIDPESSGNFSRYAWVQLHLPKDFVSHLEDAPSSPRGQWEVAKVDSPFVQRQVKNLEATSQFMTPLEQQHLVDQTPDISFKFSDTQLDAIQSAVKEVLEESINGAFWSAHDLKNVLNKRDRILCKVTDFFEKASTSEFQDIEEGSSAAAIPNPRYIWGSRWPQALKTLGIDFAHHWVETSTMRKLLWKDSSDGSISEEVFFNGVRALATFQAVRACIEERNDEEVTDTAKESTQTPVLRAESHGTHHFGTHSRLIWYSRN
eukprot:g429.t1